MSRLFAFGCSHTYGEGQIDCLNSQGPNGIVMAGKPSQYAWPTLLGKMLDKKVVNLGRPGCSNRYISQQILNTTIEKDDIIVILWTEVNRSTVFTSESIELAKVATNIHPTRNNNVCKNYYTDHESLEAVNLANYTLQEHRHVYNFKANFNSKLGVNKTDIEYVYPKWNKVNLINQSLYYVDFASDNDHPGPESQKLIARDMLKYVKETN